MNNIKTHSNPVTCNTLLTIVAPLYLALSNPDHSTPNNLLPFSTLKKKQQQLVDQCQLIKKEILDANYTAKQCDMIIHLISAWADSIYGFKILQTKQQLSNLSLVDHFNYPEYTQHYLLNTIKENSCPHNASIECLELIYIALSLGFRPTPVLKDHSNQSLDQIIQQLYDEIKKQQDSQNHHPGIIQSKNLQANKASHSKPNSIDNWIISLCLLLITLAGLTSYWLIRNGYSL